MSSLHCNMLWSKYSALNYASLGSISIGIFNNYKDVTSICEMMLAMQDQLGSNNSCKTRCKAFKGTLASSYPLNSLGDTFYDCYMRGMRTGDAEFSMWCALDHFIAIPYALGKPIGPILEDCRTVAFQTEDLNQSTHQLYSRCFRQMFTNLSKPDIPIHHRLTASSCVLLKLRSIQICCFSFIKSNFNWCSFMMTRLLPTEQSKTGMH